METAQTLGAASHLGRSAAAPSPPGAPLLNSDHFINSFLMPSGAKPHMILEVLSNGCCVEGGNPFPAPAGRTARDPASCPGARAPGWTPFSVAAGGVALEVPCPDTRQCDFPRD